MLMQQRKVLMFMSGKKLIRHVALGSYALVQEGPMVYRNETLEETLSTFLGELLRCKHGDYLRRIV